MNDTLAIPETDVTNNSASMSLTITPAGSSTGSWPTDPSQVGWAGAGLTTADLVTVSGSKTLSTPGQILEFFDISGTITVNAGGTTASSARAVSRRVRITQSSRTTRRT